MQVKSYSTHEIADLLGVSVRTLQRWRAEGTGPVWYLCGGSVRYLDTDLQAWIDKNKQEKKDGSQDHQAYTG